MRYVYLVRCSNLLKIGYSQKLTPRQQISRYKTYYPSFKISAFGHSDPKKFESYLKWKLGEHLIGGELFHNHAFDEAVKICESNCDLLFEQEIKPFEDVFLL